jgi:hypothetical protein
MSLYDVVSLSNMPSLSIIVSLLEWAARHMLLITVKLIKSIVGFFLTMSLVYQTCQD